MGETIMLTAKDGGTISAYKAQPAGAPKGGVVVIQEIWGVNHHIRSVADRFAAAGYTAIAPAFFDRLQKGVELVYDDAGRKEGRSFTDRLDGEAALRDIGAAVAAVAPAGKVAVVGFCWGGTQAFASAAKVDGLSAAVGYYGAGIAKIKDLKLRVPTALHFAELDAHIPMSDVAKTRDAHPRMPVWTYNADHGFNCDERAAYDKPSADFAWSRTLAFLGYFLDVPRVQPSLDVSAIEGAAL